jgi:hypothetical protein
MRVVEAENATADRRDVAFQAVPGRIATSVRPTQTTVELDGPALVSLPAPAAAVLASIVRSYLDAHDLADTANEALGNSADEQLTDPGVRRLHPDQHRRSAVA